MKFKVYRSKNKTVPIKVNLDDDYLYEATYDSSTKGTLTYELGKYWNIKTEVKPLCVGDVIIDENKKCWVLTEHLLFAEIEQTEIN